MKWGAGGGDGGGCGNRGRLEVGRGWVMEKGTAAGNRLRSDLHPSQQHSDLNLLCTLVLNFVHSLLTFAKRQSCLQRGSGPRSQ